MLLQQAVSTSIAVVDSISTKVPVTGTVLSIVNVPVLRFSIKIWVTDQIGVTHPLFVVTSHQKRVLPKTWGSKVSHLRKGEPAVLTKCPSKVVTISEYFCTYSIVLRGAISSYDDVSAHCVDYANILVGMFC